VHQSEGFQSLSDLLRYEARLATVSFKVGVGADGRVRGLEILALDESDENPFVSPPWRRWLAKLELFVRGYRFGDDEVMARLLDAVFDGVRREMVPLVQLFGDLELYLGALSFQARAEAAGLEVCLPELGSAEDPRVLHGLFNPLLLGHGIAPVPCDISTDRHDTTLLITGPNSGGKTRLLQSLGLAQLLAQSGLCVPARSARMTLVPALVVSLIQQTHVDQSEGRLGMELMRIRALFEHLPPSAVVILDELCSGTNPSEGEEIFELVIRMLARLRPQAFITTHFLQFAARLEKEARIDALRFLQVCLGPEQAPNYQFAPGVAQTSLASLAAARLGVTGEQLLALVERNIEASKRRGG
jgi:DNA mismatch repair protein MutS2